MSQPIPAAENPVHCVVCLNQHTDRDTPRSTPHSMLRPATWLTSGGYCGCDEHRQQLEQDGIAVLRNRNPARPAGI